MATEYLKALQTKHNHAVGNLNSLKVKTLAHGAIVDGADVDNFTLVELGFNANGDRIAKQLADVTHKSYLIATPEGRYLDEPMGEFFNAVGDFARIVILEPAYTRFETSAFSLNTGVTAIARGQVAHFNPATKKFIISDAASPHADYANASAKFLVVDSEDDLEYLQGQPIVRLEVVEA